MAPRWLIGCFSGQAAPAHGAALAPAAEPANAQQQLAPAAQQQSPPRAPLASSLTPPAHPALLSPKLGRGAPGRTNHHAVQRAAGGERRASLQALPPRPPAAPQAVAPPSEPSQSRYPTSLSSSGRPSFDGATQLSGSSSAPYSASGLTAQVNAKIGAHGSSSSSSCTNTNTGSYNLAAGRSGTSTGGASTTSGASTTDDALSALLCHIPPVHAPNPNQFRRARTELPRSRDGQAWAAPPANGAVAAQQLFQRRAADGTPRGSRAQLGAAMGVGAQAAGNAYCRQRSALPRLQGADGSGTPADLCDGDALRAAPRAGAGPANALTSASPPVMHNSAASPASPLSSHDTSHSSSVVPAAVLLGTATWPNTHLPALAALPPLAPRLLQPGMRAQDPAVGLTAPPTFDRAASSLLPSPRSLQHAMSTLMGTTLSLNVWASAVALHQQVTATLTLEHSITQLVGQEGGEEGPDDGEGSAGTGGRQDPFRTSPFLDGPVSGGVLAMAAAAPLDGGDEAVVLGGSADPHRPRVSRGLGVVPDEAGVDAFVAAQHTCATGGTRVEDSGATGSSGSLDAPPSDVDHNCSSGASPDAQAQEDLGSSWGSRNITCTPR